VTVTGMGTELGRIAELTQRAKRQPSPLELEMSRVTRLVAILAVSIGAAFFLVAGLLGMSLNDRFVFAIGVIVALVPEGLLPTVTLSLALATQRMARRNAIVRRLSSVETLGATNVICTDKTGTLTANQMTVRRIWMLSQARNWRRRSRLRPRRRRAGHRRHSGPVRCRGNRPRWGALQRLRPRGARGRLARDRRSRRGSAADPSPEGRA